MLRRLREQGLYRERLTGRAGGAHMTVGGQRLLNLCSNDYLGLPPTPVPARQFQSSSRLLAGDDEEVRGLEDALASHKGYEAALAYPAGYMANLGVIPAVAGRGSTIFSDELNHASIIDACRLSGARTVTYRHNDADDLAARLKAARGDKLIVTEGIFSMDGDVAPLREIAELAGKSGAALMVDDAHGDFAVGRDGRGTPDMLGASGGVDLYVSSLSKALGSFGGYVACCSETADLLVNSSRAFIYTSALPSALAVHARRRMGLRRDGRQGRLAGNAARMAAGLQEMGLEAGAGTHIIPVMMGGEGRAVGAGESLRRRGVLALPVRYPTVPRGRARIRVSVTAWLGGADIDAALAAFGDLSGGSAHRVKPADGRRSHYHGKGHDGAKKDAHDDKALVHGRRPGRPR